MAFEALRSEMSLDKSEYGRAIREASKETAAFGSVASDSFEEASDGAEEAGDEAQDASSGFNRFGNAIRNAVLPTRLFSSAADEAGDEASEAGRSAFGATAGFAALRLSTSGAAFSMGVFSAVTGSTIIMLGGLVTILGAVLLALAPLAIGAAAVAAAFGLIIGTGIFAGMKELKKTFKSVKKQIVPLVKEFGQKFVPFLKETIKMLPGLVKSLIDAVGGMDVFLNALRTLRNVAFKFLPKLVKWFFDLGRWALPILTDIGAFIINKVVPALRKMVGWGKEIWRIVGNWVTQFQKATKKGTKLRTKFNQLKKAGKRFWKQALKPTIKALKPLTKQLIKLAPTIGKVALDVSKLALNLYTKLLPVLIPIINAATKLVKWFNSLSYGAKRLILVAGGLLLALGPIISIVGTLISVLTTIGSVILTVVAFFNPLTLAIIAIGALIAGLAYLVIKHWDTIVATTRRLVSSVVSFFTNLGRDINQFGRNAVSAINRFVNDVVRWFNNLDNRASKIVSDTVGTLMDYLTGRRGPLSNVASAGAALIENFAQGIRNSIGKVTDAVGGVVQKARNMLPFSPAKEGPLSDLDKTGPAFVDTFADGISSNQNGLQAAVEETVALSMPQNSRQRGSRSPSEFVVEIKTEDEALKEWVDNRADVQVKDHVNGVLQQAKRRRTIK